MSLTETLNKNVMGWGTLVIGIVIISIVLLRFKTSNAGGAICPSTNSSQGYLNVSAEVCQSGAGVISPTSAISQTGTNINTTVSAIDEPVAWIAIVIIAVIGFAVLKIFKSK